MCFVRVVGIVILLYVAYVAFNAVFGMTDAFITIGGLCLTFVPDVR
jgi:hypothetical protein